MPTHLPNIGGMVNATAVPDALKALRRWAVWRAVWNEKRGKYDKIPYNPVTHVGLSTKTPDAWFDFDTALQAHTSSERYAGVGLVLTGLHTLVGIDLDNCIQNSVVVPWAQDIIDRACAYTEVSPSGNGIRILGLGSTDSDFTNHERGIEVYNGHTPRFLTVTGDRNGGVFGPLDVPVLEWITQTYRRSPRTQAAQILRLDAPEVLPDVMLPDLWSQGASAFLIGFLEHGSDGDQSLALHTAGVELYALGLSDQEVLSVLANSEAAMGIALHHRHDDYDRALQYLWVEHCQKARPKARTPQSILDDFEDCSEPREPSVAKKQHEPEKKRVRFQVQAYEEFTQARKAIWFIKKTLPRAALGVVYGESGSGKSFFVLDLVAAVARGVPWRGHKVTRSRVVYVCAEGQEDFRRRVRAYAEHHGTEEEPNGGMDMHYIDEAPNLMSEPDTQALLKQILACPGGAPDIIVIDTLAQSMVGGNENSGEDVGKVLGHCTRIHKATGALVLLIHHSGKDAAKGARGWSGLRAAADVEIEVLRDGHDRVAELTKLKGGQDGAQFAFRLVPVVLEQDEDGDDITSCVVAVDDISMPRALHPAGNVQRVLAETLQTLFEIDGQWPTSNALIGSTAPKLPRDEHPRDRRAESAMRALKTMVESGQLRIDPDGVVSMV